MTTVHLPYILYSVVRYTVMSSNSQEMYGYRTVAPLCGLVGQHQWSTYIICSSGCVVFWRKEGQNMLNILGFFRNFL